jgi:hypothetical protein
MTGELMGEIWDWDWSDGGFGGFLNAASARTHSSVDLDVYTSSTCWFLTGRDTRSRVSGGHLQTGSELRSEMGARHIVGDCVGLFVSPHPVRCKRASCVLRLATCILQRHDDPQHHYELPRVQVATGGLLHAHDASEKRTNYDSPCSCCVQGGIIGSSA